MMRTISRHLAVAALVLATATACGSSSPDAGRLSGADADPTPAVVVPRPGPDTVAPCHVSAELAERRAATGMTVCPPVRPRRSGETCRMSADTAERWSVATGRPGCGR